MHQHSSSAKEQSQAHSHFQVECEADCEPRVSSPPADGSMSVSQCQDRQAGELDASRVQSCITDPAKLSFLCGGLDWLKLYGFGGLCPSWVLEDLRRLKMAAVEGSPDVFIELGGKIWTVEPYSSGKGSNCLAYVLTWGAVRLALSARPSGPCAMIEAQGTFCAGRSPREVHDELRQIVTSVGCSPDRFVVSRLDIHADVVGVPFSRISKAFVSGNIVKRSKDWNMHGHGDFDKGTGLYFGKRGQPVIARVYDKARQLAANEDKAATYCCAHSLTEVPSVLTRVEFEMTADFFRDKWKWENSNEVLDGLSTVAEYLMNDWLRVCYHVDRNNTQLAKPASWWKFIADKLVNKLNAFGPVGERVPMVPNKERSISQVVGHVATICALAGKAPRDLNHAFEYLSELLNEEHNVRFRDKVELKVFDFGERAKQIQRRGLKAFLDESPVQGRTDNVDGFGLGQRQEPSAVEIAARISRAC